MAPVNHGYRKEDEMKTFLNNKIQNENNSYHNHVTLSPREYCLAKKSWIENFKECFS